MKKEDKIKIALPEIQKKFMEWHINKSLLYGEAFEKWWTEEGLDIFFKWAKAHNIEFMNIERKP